ncbi:hypothetical protein, unlikely [Trypanosoma brucei brucei TREU927]|uniref:Uncharacterized protein n=1 Tax=Trypanosoma brucei brucei (strain 927/4 GUTat10.1) TaxID=185431 RepID=Q38D44_TRYB2|nr:hypothetical protein, unlikely [Trypanosoma brucei brucei TREU927]EAN77276.1 hypothetical protein, unlikely [Trypanosoma brucei brucei TREU927]
MFFLFIFFVLPLLAFFLFFFSSPFVYITFRCSSLIPSPPNYIKTQNRNAPLVAWFQGMVTVAAVNSSHNVEVLEQSVKQKEKKTKSNEQTNKKKKKRTLKKKKSRPPCTNKGPRIKGSGHNYDHTSIFILSPSFCAGYALTGEKREYFF